jgi:hypothetical protein
MFRLDVATYSQKDHKLFSATYNLCSKKIANKKIEGSPLYSCKTLVLSDKNILRIFQLFIERIQRYVIIYATLTFVNAL